MAYSNSWSVVIPSGTVPASTIDEHIRQLRLDIQERMNDVVVDWTTDPVVMSSVAMPTGMKHGGYYALGATEGTRATAYGEVTKVLAFIMFGNLDLGGGAVIDLDEYNAPKGNPAGYYHVNNLVGMGVVPLNNAAGPYHQATGWATSTATVSNTIGLQFNNASDGFPASSLSMTAYVIMMFNG